jgi:phosphoglycerate dehydrogenase-like enzyme
MLLIGDLPSPTEEAILPMKLLIHPPRGERWLSALRERVPSVEVVEAASPEEALGQIGDADAFYGRITPPLLAAARRLRWIQAPMAGLEGSMFPELIGSDVVLSNMRGIYSEEIADHAYCMLLMLARGMPALMRAQQARDWRGGRSVRPTHLGDATLGIVGLGGIGREVARRAAASGMRILAVDPRPEERPADVETVWSVEQLPAMLAQSDFVVICAPHTPQTQGMFDSRAFAAMKPGSYLINISRGVIVQLAALVDALQSGRLAGAALDVYEVEPLPREHLLWSMENVILTPHVAAVAVDYEARRLQVLSDNLARFAAGETPRNVVDKASWF